MFSLTLLCGLAIAGVSFAAPDVQQNYTICSWARLRATIIRDAIYLDGGLLWWQTAFVDGSTPVVSSDGGVSGDMYRLNLSQPFDTTSTNLSALLQTMPKAGGQGNNIAPNYVDGAMLSNDDELYMYGGLPRLTNATSGQAENAVLGYEADQYGPYRESWSPGFYQGTLGTNVTRFITNGAAANAPSENLAFYLSGMRSPGWGEIYYEDSSATVPANTMIEVDLSTMRDEKWTNLTLPNDILPRANAELIWVPVSDRGVLVAIGGVTEPEEVYPTGLDESQTSRSETVSPSFMESIPVYDIASETWFIQNVTSGEKPPQLTQFCSVLAVANDSSAFDIYIYGGYNGINATDDPSDDVWVLSLPSFTWTKVYEGTQTHGRSGHHCISPYPDKMFVIGGVHQDQAQCVEGGFLQVFNLNKLEFQNQYLPSDWDNYEQPQKIKTATNLKKRQLQWASPELEKIFSTKYTREIAQYYPYETSGQTSDDSSTGHGSGSSTNTTAIAVGVSIGALILGLTIVLILLLRRKGMLRSRSSMSSRTKRSRISHWLNGARGSPPHSKNLDNDSASELDGDLIQQYSNASAIASSDSSHTPIFTTTPARPPRVPQEMAAVDRPHPPFELATPYNNQAHPKNSNAIDYAYDSKLGHSSRSNSSEYVKLPVLQTPTPYDDLVQEARGSVDHAEAAQSSTNATTPSTSSTTSAWPLPASRPTWYRSPSAISNPTAGADATEHLLAPLPPPTTVPAIPQQYRSVGIDKTPSRLRPVLPEAKASNTTSDNSSSSQPSSQSQQVSSISSVVSPIHDFYHPDWEEQTTSHRVSTPQQQRRQSLMEAVLSPVSPCPEDGKGQHSWGQQQQTQPRKRSDDGEGKERWWGGRS